MPFVAHLGFFLPVLVFPAPMSVVAFVALRSFLLFFIACVACRCSFWLFIALDINNFHRTRTGANE